MPNRPRRPCNHPGCKQLTNTGYCEQHQPKPWADKQDLRRFKGRHLQRERDRLFDQHPLCMECEKAGVVRASTQRDHIIPLAEGGLDIPENTQALCDDCHKLKSQAEAQRGRWGGR
jgi:5-methylcytosine-specific restriction enzyme A